MAEIATGEGLRESVLPGVKLMRSSIPTVRTPVSYQPCIVIIAQGQKRGYLGDQVFTYDANRFLVLAVPLPFECETLAAPDGPLLGLSVEVPPATVAELLVKMKRPEAREPEEFTSLGANPLDETLYDAATRLATALRSEEEATLLGPQIVREIIYRVLCTRAGDPLRAMGAPHSHFGRISSTLQIIHRDYAQSLEVSALARQAGMSVSAFHQHFKAITGTPPLRYLKNIRLHKARLLMVQDGETAASASRLVGYESSSQFSREFKSYFGNTPAAESALLRDHLIELT
ncbi:MAG: AraC family transcriptional regulator [Verrucomicrobiota bacterium JB023]|nr:AraC family transcriptional regulator [Verrucomicrobiota bacterium JB023]